MIALALDEVGIRFRERERGPEIRQCSERRIELMALNRVKIRNILGRLEEVAVEGKKVLYTA